MAEKAPHAAMVRLFRLSPELVAAVVEIALREAPGVVIARSSAEIAAQRASLLDVAIPGNLGPQSENFSYLGNPSLVGTKEVKGQTKDVKLLGADVVREFLVDGVTRLVVIIEPQGDDNRSKFHTLLHYWAEVKAYLRFKGIKDCPVMVILVTLDDQVARWAAQGIDEHPVRFSPDVIHRGNIPKVTDPEMAKANPGLAILSAAANPLSRELDSRSIKCALK